MKKYIIFSFVLLFFIIIIFGVVSYLHIPKDTLVFKESNKEVFNPGRGFYIQINSNEAERFEELKNENIKIALVAYDIKKYINTKITEDKLKELETVLEEARKYNIKVVFRAAYGFTSKYKDPETMDDIYTHIKQIAPIINANKDTILSVQAGFIGPWGEWHSSKFFTGDENEVRVRNEMLSVLLDNLNKDIIVNVRRPRFIRDAIAYGIDKSRLGLHNDALLSTKDDMGTYDDPNYTREKELEWVKENIARGVNGGEIPTVSEYSNINNAVKELKSLQMTYLNSRYNIEVLKEWKSTQYNGQNALEYINNHLGYRLSLREVELLKYINTYGKFKLKAVLLNSGFAPIDDDKKIFLIMKRGNEILFNSMLEGQIFSINGDMSKEFTVNTSIGNLFKKDSGEDILVGVYIANTYIPSNIDGIELANSDIVFEEGVNFFARYKFENKKYILKPISE